MKSSVKAALLSGLILPGAGQLWLKRWVWGAVLLLAALASLAVMTARLAKLAYQILEPLESAGGSIDLLAVVRTAQTRGGADPVVQAAGLVLVASWTIGVIHAYLAGRKKDLERRNSR